MAVLGVGVYHSLLVAVIHSIETGAGIYIAYYTLWMLKEDARSNEATERVGDQEDGLSNPQPVEKRFYVPRALFLRCTLTVLSVSMSDQSRGHRGRCSSIDPKLGSKRPPPV